MNVTVSCGGIADKETLHARIAAALDFPDWYGHNLDALYDLLTETTVGALKNRQIQPVLRPFLP